VQIACPNCHTRYALDDRLVPTGGAPVQCTRCGLVFTAQRGGDPAASPQAGPPSGTLPFGSSARTAGPIRTEAYGQSPPPAPSTQVFGSGAPAAPPPSAQSAGRTQVFGGAGAEAGRTQVFGAGPGPGPARPVAPPAPPPGANRTQVFGGPPAPPSPPPGAPSPAGRTQVFGGAPSPPPPPSSARTAPDAVARTQVFGGSGARPAPPPEPSPAMRTQVFGGAAAGGPSPPAPSSAMRTAVFGGAAADPGQAGLDLPPMPEDEFLSGGAPSLDLPGAAPEPLPVPGVVPTRPPRPDPAERALAQQLQRRNQRAVWGVIGLVLLGALGYAGWSLVGSRSGVPANVRADRDAAFALLRRDDPQSRASAMKVLDALVTRYPQWVAARATQALAQTLELDDQRALLKRGLADAEQLKTQIARLEAERTPADWKAQADTARARLDQLRKQTDPMIDAVNQLESKLNAARDALNRLPPGNEDDERARLRADAVFAGVAGRAERAISDAERYRQLGGQDGWGEVAYAEYVLSARSAPPDSLEQAVKSMNDVMARDTTFIRPYVLAGRLLLALRQRDQALSKLDAAVALNPKHVLAQALIDQERSK